MLEHEPRQVVGFRELLEHVLRRRRLTLRSLAEHGQREAVVENLLQLLRRAQVERPAGRGERRSLRRGHRDRELLALRTQHSRVDHHAGPLHSLEHAQQRPLDVEVDALEVGQRVEPPRELVMQRAARRRPLRPRSASRSRPPPDRTRSASRLCRRALRTSSLPGRGSASRSSPSRASSQSSSARTTRASCRARGRRGSRRGSRRRARRTSDSCRPSERCS